MRQKSIYSWTHWGPGTPKEYLDHRCVHYFQGATVRRVGNHRHPTPSCSRQRCRHSLGGDATKVPRHSSMPMAHSRYSTKTTTDGVSSREMTKCASKTHANSMEGSWSPNSRQSTSRATAPALKCSVVCLSSRATNTVKNCSCGAQPRKQTMAKDESFKIKVHRTVFKGGGVAEEDGENFCKMTWHGH